MHITTFTERPYADVPEDEVIKNSSFFGVSNKFLNPARGGELFNRYLDEKVYAEELGYDGVMLNEHHANPFTLGAVMDVEAAILARITSKVKIALMGNPLPVADPLRLAEELATIDMISGGRLITGWVRGAGCEQIANNVNPTYNRERFNEAHDFIMQAWSKEGPWRYEGKHYEYRHVNPWVKPIQSPIPETWIPSLVSPETAEFAARNRYTYLALATFLPPTVEMWNLFADTAEKEGYQAGPECFGYMQKVVCADTEEEAYELGKNYVYGGGQPAFARPEWMFPAGYNSKAATKRMAYALTDPETNEAIVSGKDASQAVNVAAMRKYNHEVLYENLLRNRQIITGTPESVLPKIRHIMETLRPGVFSIWHIEGGSTTSAQSMNSMKLLGENVLPQMREWAKELDLPGPSEVKPGSRKLPANGKRDPVVDASIEAA
ncbi:MAG: LLM class flavin-dependent oxidoreductase [Gammaproteobacteria bacterium]|nr:LLM class flavin-dependent oxidoreductase [Gammaproteobacteria bacterium]MBQ0839953.1 LLM class flavin-dependent oxidoreductase [Gammaproteobacteria bacterium]